MIPDRLKRINEACREALGEVIQEKIKDPRVGFVTVTRVEVSPDLRQAKVWLSVLGSEEEVDMCMLALQKARGFMRRELGRRVRIRYTPELRIFLDRGAQVSERVQGILKRLDGEEEK